MKLKHYSEEKLKRQILEICARHLDLKQYDIVFFGSRIKGDYDERSDIDVGIKGPEPVSSLAMAKIRDELQDLPLLYSIDVVDLQKSSSEFRDVAQNHVEKIN